MGTWPEYLKNSFGLRIFLGVCLFLSISIIASTMIERKRLEGCVPKEHDKMKSINTIKRLWIGMLAGFVATVIIGVTQFIVRFGYFTLLQEIGAVVFGLIGAIVGGLLGVMKWGRKVA